MSPLPAAKQQSWWQSLLTGIYKKPRDRWSLIKQIRGAYKQKVIDPIALNMLEGVIGLVELKVRDIMVPKTQMITLRQTEQLTDILPTVLESAHSRFPVLGDTADDVVGILLAKDLLAYGFGCPEQEFQLQRLLRPVLMTPESKRLDALLQEFRLNRNHMAIVVDEYGILTGLITIEDILEQIVGDIEDEYDIEDEISIKQHAERVFSVKAITPIKEFNEFFAVQLQEQAAETIGGLLLQKFGYLPKAGDSVKLGSFLFKVLRANARRLILIQVTLLAGEKCD